MRGKRSFTKTEIEQIKKLIVEKKRSSSNKQKGIRAKIRRIGFYYSDFSSSKHGYDVADFEELIHLKKIKEL